MDAVTSGHFRSELTGTILGGLPLDLGALEIEFVIYGEFQAPDRSSYTIATKVFGITSSQRFITIGVHGYNQHAQSDIWFYVPGAAGNLGSRNHLGDIDLRLPEEVIALFTLDGVQDLNGMPVYYMKGEIPDSAARTILGEMPPEGGERQRQSRVMDWR